MISLFVDSTPSHYNNNPIYSLFIPFCILLYTHRRSWAQREGFERHHAVRRGEGFTDDENDL
ncbi:hypothetical protein K435DRAFT_657765 [Dendrothele bispora CBS 962.96]|uniref:Uncharacterized protein n=1 Tax=Dendrothele bispora (strain CBS 962.96) TaxID=1314807 RepID=A0A4S8MCN5_DENBC|nr:hypothetical protein K435DRAFT_657765 [Dendrothele bispora CBS 962.96]